MVMYMFCAAALAMEMDGPEVGLAQIEGQLHDPVAMLHGYEKILDVAAAPAGVVVLTLDLVDGEGPLGADSYALTIRKQGEVAWRHVFEGTEHFLAVDHYAALGSEYDVQVFVALEESGAIWRLEYDPLSGQGELHLHEEAPMELVDLYDIAAGTKRIYVLGSDKLGELRLARHASGLWIDVGLAQGAPGPGALSAPAIDLDRTRDRVTLGWGKDIRHYASNLQFAGSCTLENDAGEPLLGREFSVEEGVLVYINRNASNVPFADLSTRMHVADADDCISRDSLLLNGSLGGLNAMSIEPQPFNGLWRFAGALEPKVVSWTPVGMEAWGLLRTEAWLARPW